MPTTSPDSIYYADGTTPASIATITSAMATSVQNALLFREAHSFAWANTTERSAQTGMAVGDIGYQIDNLVYYRWNGSAWKIWAKAPAGYTPTLVNITASSLVASYSIASGIVTVNGTINNSTTTTSGITMTLPTGFNIDTTYVYTGSLFHKLGTASYLDASASVVYDGFVAPNSATVVQFGRFVSSTANLTVGAVGGATNPFGAAWASGDLIAFNFSYPVA
jgi:hypothetical protein